MTFIKPEVTNWPNEGVAVIIVVVLAVAVVVSMPTETGVQFQLHYLLIYILWRIFNFSQCGWYDFEHGLLQFALVLCLFIRVSSSICRLVWFALSFVHWPYADSCPVGYTDPKIRLTILSTHNPDNTNNCKFTWSCWSKFISTRHNSISWGSFTLLQEAPELREWVAFEKLFHNLLVWDLISHRHSVLNGGEAPTRERLGHLKWLIRVKLFYEHNKIIQLSNKYFSYYYYWY